WAGWSVITQSLSNCYHFRLIAPKDFRVQVTATRMKISFDEAEKEIELQQAKRDSFINKFLKCNMNDPSYYHALYNNKSCDINKIAKSILYTIGLF
ncbi:MAG: cytidylate kinase-like family protein, partial [Deltaproteobacteria bacterium]|nr:cytidylate kinase-like family protein [Deltaproteobacteria bacterium]